MVSTPQHPTCLTEKANASVCRRKGFTLIELLVVIATIAVLIAIILPALECAKRQTKAVMCQSSLREWGNIFMMFTMDNDGYLLSATSGEMWTTALESYYKDAELRCCPTATEPASPMGAPNPLGGTFLAWGIFDSTFAALGLEGGYGSYGMNGYASNPEPGVEVNPWGYSTRNNWRSPNVKASSNIPLFLDSAWLGGFPLHDDEPPDYDGQAFGSGPGGSGDEMRQFCMNRHRRAINGLLLDFSVKKIGLKRLWKLKWHREFDTHASEPAWPDWMKDM